MIVQVDSGNIGTAAVIHSIAWKESHRGFCSPEFVELHTPARQLEYLQKKLDSGSAVYMLVFGEAVGIVSVLGDTIEDLYVLPAFQRRGFGSILLQHAISCCRGVPALWILENNIDAERLYLNNGFQRTGRRISHDKGFDEVELALKRR